MEMIIRVTSKGNTLVFSTNDIELADHIGSHLELEYKNEIDKGNRVIFTSNTEHYKHSKKIKFNYYEEWLEGKLFNTKNFYGIHCL